MANEKEYLSLKGRSPDLKPCPFCGQSFSYDKYRIIPRRYGGYLMCVECAYCEAQSRTFPCSDLDTNEEEVWKVMSRLDSFWNLRSN